MSTRSGPGIINFDDELVQGWHQLLARLIRFPSVFEKEHAVVEMVAERISSLGIELHEVPISAPALKQLPDAQPPFSEVPSRKNLVARVPGSRHGRSLILNCHLDIVPAGNLEEWTRPAFGGQVDEARRIIYGRGAMDDKAGVAIGLAVLELAASKVIRPQGDLIVQFVLEDESTGNGSLLCLSNGFTADAAIILDGTRRDWGINQHVGSMQFAIEMPGRPASVSVSHMGINAAEMLSELLLELRSSIFALNDARAAPWTQYPSPNQFVTQSFNAEGRQLTVPDRAGAICYLTFTPPHTLQELRQRIEVIAHDFAGQRRIGQPRLRWEGFFACEPVASASRELEAVIQTAAAACGMERISFGPSTGVSDLRHFVARGIPCVLYGPGRGFNPHRADEHYYLDDLPLMVGIIQDVIRRWCSSAGP